MLAGPALALSLAALAIPSPGISVPEDGETVHADVRFLVQAPLPGEPFVAALRLHDGLGEENARERLKPFQLDEVKYEMIDPEGGLHVARFPSAKLAKLKLRPIGDTILFVAEPEHVTLRLEEDLDERPPLEPSRWRQEERVDLDLAGRWKLQFSGVLRFADSRGGPVTWVEGWYEVDRRADPAPDLDRAALVAAARAAIDARADGERLGDEVWPWISTDDGGRAVSLAGRTSKGVRSLYQVAFSPRGELSRITRHPIRAKRSPKRFERAFDDSWERLWPADPEVLFPAPESPEDEGGQRRPGAPR